jgi:hypothetical protein
MLIIKANEINYTKMSTDDINLLQEKAKLRNNGVYSFKEYSWVVKDNKFVAFSDYYGNCYQRMGAFNVSIGKVDRYDIKKKLKEWLKSQM